MKEAQEIANYIAERMNWWKKELKEQEEKEDSLTEQNYTRGQIWEAGKILKHIQDEYGINPNNQ